MEKNIGYYFHLLECFLKEKAPEPKSEVDLEKIFEIAVKNGNGALISWVYKTYGLITDNKEFKVKTEKFLMAEFVDAIHRESLLDNILDKFEGENIRYVLFKGSIVKDFYPIKELRRSCDTDILIKLEDVEKADKILKESGCTLYQSTELHRSYYRKQHQYDIHLNIFEVPFKNCSEMIKFFDAAWSYTEKFRGNCGYKFTPEFHIVFLLAHIAKHMLAYKIMFRMIFDIAVVIERCENVDWGLVKQYLTDIELLPFGEFLVSLCSYLFGSRKVLEGNFNEEHYSDFLEYMNTLSTKNYEETYTDVEFRDMLKNSDINTVKKKLIFERVFPPLKNLKVVSPILNKLPFLYPVFIVKRWFLALVNPHKAIGQVKNINSFNESSERTNRLFSDIGLDSKK